MGQAQSILEREDSSQAQAVEVWVTPPTATWRYEQEQDWHQGSAQLAAWQRRGGWQTQHAHVNRTMSIPDHLEQVMRMHEQLPAHLWSTFNQMRHELLSLRHAHESQRKELEALRRELAEVRQLLKGYGDARHPEVISDPELDALDQWKLTHVEELARYRGKRVAFHPERGIIAVADDYDQLLALLREMGVADSEVIIDVISPWLSDK